MGKDNKPQIVTINGVDYDAESFTEDQVLMFNHCVDLDRKIGSTTFQLQQLQGGKDYFVGLLENSLKATKEQESQEKA